MSKYNIQVASNLSGVGTHTLRAWEKRYQAVVPARNESGRRMYDDDDIEKLKILSELCSLGHSIGSIASKEVEELKVILKKLGKHTFDQKENFVVENNPQKAKESLNNLLLALEVYKLDVISHELKKLQITLSPRDLAMNILIPLLTEVGHRVFRGTLSIAQEHALSSIIKFHVGHILYKSYETKYKNPNLIALATAENDYHEFGIMLSALLCCHHGINFFYLGPNMPSESLVKASESVEANIVILGTTPNQNHLQTNYLDNYIDQVLKRLDKRQELWIGGQGNFNVGKVQKNRKATYLPSLEHLDSMLKELTQ